ncbi:hypothetical protein ATPR_1048 [Acetobacter tropicalis NBRC 101654]|uniref:Uncharacterized protein n=1 Tax=Acetobacter tropicalis NBRC 101654 TaxID=749388 RepID=F7VCE9_9PROT|nr:hypothetical protein ATPR_1048 [Acetobacter tropicalis NBRC 101654]
MRSGRGGIHKEIPKNSSGKLRKQAISGPLMYRAPFFLANQNRAQATLCQWTHQPGAG